MLLSDFEYFFCEIRFMCWTMERAGLRQSEGQTTIFPLTKTSFVSYQYNYTQLKIIITSYYYYYYYIGVLLFSTLHEAQSIAAL